MADTVDIKRSVLHRDYFYVYDVSDNPVTGLVQADFDIDLVIDAVSATRVFVITEVNAVTDPGLYMITFTPDTGRMWNLHIMQATYNVIGWMITYRVMDQLVDDIRLENMGLGNRVVRVMVEDEADGTPIADAFVVVYNQAMNAKLAFAFSKADGTITFMLDDGHYHVLIRKIGQYEFDNPFDLVVSGATSATYEGTRFSPDEPAAPDLCNVYGWALDQQGQPVSVTVNADVVGDRLFLRTHPGVIRKKSTTSSRANDGYWVLALTRSAQFTKAGVKYTIMVNGVNLGAFVIPDQESVGIHELMSQAQCAGR